MQIHKKTRLTPIQRKQLADDYFKNHIRVCDLIRKYQISAPTVYKIIHRSRNNDYSIHKSINKRFRCLEYGLKRLSKIEKQIEEKLKKKAKRYNKKYPGEMIHMDVKRLPLLRGESPANTHEYLFIGIDDFSREIDWHQGLPALKVSCPEKAFLEMMMDVPKSISFDHANEIMQGMTSLSPNKLGSLLNACKSIKAKRLFLWFAEKQGYAWFKKLDLTDVDLGTGNRVIAKAGKLDKKYLITVPEHLYE